MLPDTIHNDRLEGEFGVYWQSSGGCYNIYVQQLTNSLSLQRLKLFDKLGIESTSKVKEDFCSGYLKKEVLDECFELISKSTEVEVSSLYYIGGC